MRKAVPLLVCVAAPVAVAGPVTAAPPPDDEATALDRFTVVGETRGYELVDPSCQRRSSDEPEYLCFARVGPDPDDLFVIRTDLSSDLIDYTVVAEPDDRVPADNLPPHGAELASFDAFSYFIAMFSADPKAFDPLYPVTAPGSPAEAYLTFQYEVSDTAAELELDLGTASMYLTANGPRMCPGGDAPCSDITDIVVNDGMVESFSVDGNPIAPRLGVPGEAVTVGDSSFRVVAAYRTVSSDDLMVYLEIASGAPVVLDLATATYLTADGAQVAVDPDSSIGAATFGTEQQQFTLALAFPQADPGGTLRFSVFPADGSTPLAAHVPVPALLADAG